jgi:hypothetical protein
MTTNSNVEHLGSSFCPGSSAGTISCELFEITSVVSISNTGANATHQQGIRLYIPAPSN